MIAPRLIDMWKMYPSIEVFSGIEKSYFMN
jgi:hypothetical protein